MEKTACVGFVLFWPNPISIQQVVVSTLFSFNNPHCAIRHPTIRRSVNRDPDRKIPVVSANDLDAANGVAAGPILYRVNALFSECCIDQALRYGLSRHQLPNLTDVSRSDFAN